MADGHPAPPFGSEPRKSSSGRDAAWAGGTAAAFLALSLGASGRVPAGLTADPAAEAMRGIRLVSEGRLEAMTFSVGQGAETLALYLQGLFVILLGPTRLAASLHSMLLAAATAGLAVLLTRRLFPEVTPALPAILALGSTWLFHYGQVGLRTAAAPVFLAATALALDAAATKGGRGRAMGAGFLLGVGVWAYTACRLLPLAWGGWIVWRLARATREGRTTIGRETAFTMAGLALAALPVIPLLVGMPALFLERGYYVLRGGAVEKAFNLASTFLLPFGTPDRYAVWQGPGHEFDVTGVALVLSGVEPLDLVTGLAFIAGLWNGLRSTARLRPGASFLAAAWFVGTALLGISGPSPTRLLILVPVYIVFAAKGLASLANALPPAGRFLAPLAAAAWLGYRVYAYAGTFGSCAAAQELFQPRMNALSERARDEAHSGRRVLVAAAGSHHVLRYYVFRDFRRIFFAGTWPRVPPPSEVPVDGFAPEVVLVERVPELDAVRRALAGRGRPDVSSRPADYAEYHLEENAGRTPSLPGNIRKLWSSAS